MIKQFSTIIKHGLLIASFAITGQSLAYKTTAKLGFVYDLQSQQVLFNKNGDMVMYPASMTKIMTAYVVFEAIKSGKISLDDKFYVSKKAWKMGGSRMFLLVDTQVSVEQLLKGLIVQSGNDSSVVLAEGLSGTEENFADLMNETAKRLGMKNTNFVNSTGWPNENHYTTALDLVILSNAIIHDFPEYYSWWKIKNYTFNNIKQGNRNPLLYMNMGADGLKTGHTQASGFGLTGSAVQGDRRIIFVLNGMVSKRERKEQSANMVREFLFKYRNALMVKADEVLDLAPVNMQYGVQVPLVSNKDIYISKRNTNQNKNIVMIEYKSPLNAPIKKGQEIGAIIIQEVDKNNTPVLNRKYPLYANADVEKNSVFGRVYSFIMTTLFGTP